MDINSQLYTYYLNNRKTIGIINYYLTKLYILCKENDKKASDKVIDNAKDVISTFNINGVKSRVFYVLNYLVREYLSQWSLSNKLRVTPDWLKGWFFIKIYDSQLLDEHLCKNSPYSPEDTLTFLKHLATLGLYLLHWIENQGESRRFPFTGVVEGDRGQLTAILYLLAEYAHVEGGLTRKAELFRTLEAVWSNEAVLYTIRDTYRDHINHMVETCLLGLLLIELKDASGRDYYFHQLRQGDDQRLRRNWVLAALLHDTGYALEICKRAGHPLKFMDTPQVVRFAENFGAWLAQEEKAAMEKITAGLQRPLKWLWEGARLEKFDHGVVSALFTLFLVKDGKKPEDNWRSDIRPALDAMARHNLKRRSTSYWRDPMAFLLILCDHLQEWDRPLVQGPEMRQALVVHMSGKDWAGIDNESRVAYLELENVEFHGRAPTLKSGRELTFNLHFSEVWGERYHPPPTWLTHTYDLQSLTQCPDEISIRLIHPVDPARGPEMDLFQTFLMKEQRLAVLRDWAVRSRRGQDWFRYTYRFGENKEEFTFHLQKCGGEEVILGIPEGCIPDYLEFWRKRNPTAPVR
jgi:hypothetical protein